MTVHHDLEFCTGGNVSSVYVLATSLVALATSRQKMMFEAGSVAILTGHLNYLLPHYYVLNALILSGRADAEWALRTAVLKAQVAVGLLEILWVSRFRQGLSLRACSVLSCLAALLEGAHVLFAFLASPEVYTMRLALVLKFISLCLQIPLAQVGTAYILRRRMSPARYRIIAWLVACIVALVVLLDTRFARWWLALFVVAAPLLFSAVVIHVSAREDPLVSSDAMAETASSKATAEADQLCTGVPEAGAFLLLGCMAGTIGEALTDMATTLAIRKSLQGGNNDLALTNQLMVLSSMLLAYWCETKPSASSSRKSMFFISLWALCQVFRVLALKYVEEGSVGKVLLGGMVFMDKYSGPLGSAALDMALLAVLIQGDERLRSSASYVIRIPGSLLWTLRTAVTRMERPICQLLLLHGAGISVEWLSSIFTAFTTTGVCVILARQRGVEQKSEKED